MRTASALAALVVLETTGYSRSRAGDAAPSAPAPSASEGSLPVPSEPAVTEKAQAIWTWNFDADSTDAPPRGFSFGRTGGGANGAWAVRAAQGAPSGPNALAQLDADATSFRFPIAVANAPRLRDVRLSVSCKVVSGKVDQACGLVARYRGANDYLITRANALENNVRLYTVMMGKRREIASSDVVVSAGVWHEYVFELRSSDIRVSWDGKRVIEHRDDTFLEPGLVGLWTKADSVTYFDNLSAEAL
jgi:hypothetical protein